ncbi:hypothetical protein GCM10009549_49280 [Streptomyces thermoalcalitolerans]|uniref:Uncharacterized protein n=1 Tax=Streptomyces thermoalcalitolerans TaxID=65605 RepID=A0ABN1PFY6_9ACTN
MALTSDQKGHERSRPARTERFTKALPTRLDTSETGTRLAFLACDNKPGCFITRLGLVQRFNTVGTVDRSITIDPMRTTAHSKKGGRIFSYERVSRYFINSDFAELVKHGLAGTVGTSVGQLRDFGLQRAHAGYSVVLGFEASEETPRSVRARSRSTRKRPKVHSYSPSASQQQ